MKIINYIALALIGFAVVPGYANHPDCPKPDVLTEILQTPEGKRNFVESGAVINEKQFSLVLDRTRKDWGPIAKVLTKDTIKTAFGPTSPLPKSVADHSITFGPEGNILDNGTKTHCSYLVHNGKKETFTGDFKYVKIIGSAADLHQ